jgi:hypothetical protein
MPSVGLCLREPLRTRRSRVTKSAALTEISSQPLALDHGHRALGDKYADTIGWSADNGQHPGGNFTIGTNAPGGNETRPTNAYVTYCIRDRK